MSTEPQNLPSRALVLGGGGVTGIAWEIGLLAGLRAAGVDLSTADAVIGTSAGAFVGAALTSGHDLERLFTAQSRPNDQEVSAVAPEEVVTAWYDAFATGGTDPQKVGVAFGRIGKSHPAPVPLADRRAVVQARLTTTEWPPNLRVTAIDADTGLLHVFDASSDVSLLDAVSASGAVPGVWPLERFAGRSWVDGGMVSTANARLAEGHERVVVIAPMPDGYGAIPGAAQDVAAMSTHTRALLVAPDQDSVTAIGPNIYDPTRREPAATAGRAQGTRLAAILANLW